MKTLIALLAAFLLVGCSSDGPSVTEPVEEKQYVIQDYRTVEYEGKGNRDDIAFQDMMMDAYSNWSLSTYNDFCEYSYDEVADSVNIAKEAAAKAGLTITDEIVLQTIWDICENPYL